ncbi:MAG TPA: hypothetical protein V6D29_22815 [Leptolyngbyaceae cyanobacterium]
MFDWITGKKVRVSFSLSPASLETLDAIADQIHLTRAQVIEALAEGQLSLNSETAKTEVTISADGVTAEEQPRKQSSEAVEALTPADNLESEAVEAPTSADNPASVSDKSPEQSYTTPLFQPASQVLLADSRISHQQNEADSNDALHQQITSLKQQLADLQTYLTQQRARETAQKAQNTALTHQVQEQQQRIEILEQQASHLQQMATIGEIQLNRWRSHTYSR